MQFSALFAAIFAAAVAASPLDLPVPKASYSGTPTSTRPAYPYPTASYDGCTSDLYNSPQCCATDVLGLADLDCHSPASVPQSANEFRYTCAAGGQRARCCIVPVAGQALLCETPAGV